MLVSKVWPYRIGKYCGMIVQDHLAMITFFCIDKIDFMRDIIAFVVVVGTVIGVAFDGAVCEIIPFEIHHIYTWSAL